MNAPHTDTQTDPPSSTSTGAAVHHDLYREQDDPGKLIGEARKLGVGFVVVFSCFFGGISMALNQATAPEPVVSFENAGEIGAIDSAGLFAFEFASGSRTRAVTAVNTPIDWDALRSVTLSQTHVRLVVDRQLKAVLVAPSATPQAPVKAVRFSDAVDLPAQKGYVYAWEHARLARVIPTRWLIMLGAVLGVLCFVPPLGVLIYKGWMGYVARPLAWINTRLILSILFFGMFSPMALVLAIRRRLDPKTDALARAPRPKDESYWLKREIRDRKHFEHWF